MWCFQCGAEYSVGVVECLECGVGLVAEAPLAPEEVGTDEEEQLAYEFHDWAFESRRMLDQLLTGRGIAHSWQGATMIVRAADESAVDDLVEEVEHATLPTLDPELEQVVYEMAGWSAEQQTLLSARLGAEGIPHEFDAHGDLVLHAEDEDRIETLLDEIEQNPLVATSAEDRNHDGDDDDDVLDLDGLDVNKVLSALFEASDRLRRNARDANGVLHFLDNAPTVQRISMPFGYERPIWNALVNQVRGVESLLEDDHSDDTEIEEQAKRLRDVLVGLI